MLIKKLAMRFFYVEGTNVFGDAAIPEIWEASRLPLLLRFEKKRSTATVAHLYAPPAYRAKMRSAYREKVELKGEAVLQG